MPYVDESRRNRQGIQQPPRWRCWTIGGSVLPFNSASMMDGLFGNERLWSYRTGKKLIRQTNQQELTGKQIRDLIYHNKEFELNSLGGITVTGEPASNSTLYPYDTGHNLRQLKTSILRTGIRNVDIICKYGLTPVHYNGPVWLGASDATTPWVLPQWSDTAESVADYNRANRAIARNAPTAPSSNFSRAVGELMKDGLPALTGKGWLQEFRRQPKINGIVVGKRHFPIAETGGEYLNYQFGVSSTINDIQKTARSVKKSQQLLENFMKVVNGDEKIYRRTALLDEAQDVRNSSINVLYNTEMGTLAVNNWNKQWLRFGYLFQPLTGLPGNIYQNRTLGSETWLLKRQTSLVCAYTIFQQDLTDFVKRMEHYGDAADRLLGLRLDASLIYDLTPWTWMTNWWFDLGGMISRAESLASESIALRYGYVTKSYDLIQSLSTENMPTDLNGRVHRIPARTTEWRSFSRWRATPYGFGLNSTDFSSGKWAILAALGISKGGKILRFKEIP